MVVRGLITNTEFTVKREHIKLIDNLCIFANDTPYLRYCPSVYPKKPFGNSDIVGDVKRITGETHADEATHLYWDLIVVLQILCDNASRGIKAGKYKLVKGKWTYKGKGK